MGISSRGSVSCKYRCGLSLLVNISNRALLKVSLEQVFIWYNTYKTGEHMKAKDLKKLKNAAKKIGNMETIIDRNGCPLLVPANDGSEAQKLMDYAKANMRLYAIDGVLFDQGDVVSIDKSGIMTAISVKDHTNKIKGIKNVMIPQENLDKIEKFFIKNNFSSYEQFKNNLLPSFNGPDGACYVSIQQEGMTFGYEFKLPVKKF